MPFAAALSTHPVSAYAAGEVIGDILERVGPGPDLLVLVGRPGHAGAMEDIAATAQSLLEPGVIVGGVAAGVGGADGLVDDGPALALWAAQAGPAEAWAPGRPARPGSFTLSLVGGRPDADSIETDGADMSARLQGPLVAAGGLVTPGPVGVAVHSSWAPSLFTLPSMVPVGPPLVMTEAGGRRIARLEGQPALPLLLDVIRSQRALARFGGIRSMALRVLPRDGGTAGELALIAGSDRESGDLVLAEDVDIHAGDLAILHIPAPDGFQRLLTGFAGGADAEAALVFTAIPAGAPLVGGELDPESTPLPAATLILASPRLRCAPAEGTADREPAAAVALFP